MRQSFRYKLLASKRLKHLHVLVEVAGRIYNHAIAVHRTYYRLYKRHLPKARLQAHIAKLKRTRFPQWALLNSQSAQAVADRIEAGYQLFFLAKKEGRKGVRLPSFRKLSRFRSFTLKQTGWKLLEPGLLEVQGRKYRFRQSREIGGAIKTVTLQRNVLGEFFVSFSCDGVRPPQAEAATGQAAGFDFGLKTFLTRDDGTKYHAPQPLRSGLRRLRKANRALSRKRPGSNGRGKAKANLARVHQRIANVRSDWQWKLARDLVRQHSSLGFEDLALSGMTRRWGRKMADLGLADFLGKAKWLCAKHGRVFAQTPRFEPTTQRCSCCGQTQPIDLSERTYRCGQCGATVDRDTNAAKNIKAYCFQSGRGLAREVTVSPAPQAVPVTNAESHRL